MDTRFWGPSGWKMLHLITFDYIYSPTNAIVYAKFFESLPYILPCKYCRASLTDYYRKYPFKIHNTLNVELDFKKWLYTIHNCVNDKLRKQELNPNPNPKYSDIKQFYENWQRCDWEKQLTIFWEFLFAVAYNHPKEITTHSKPIDNCPSYVYKCKDKCEKNKWNILSLSDRLYWFKRFWMFLPAVLPVEIAKKWEEIEKDNLPTLDSRRSTLAWLWRMRCKLDSKFKDPYTSICKKIATYSSNCGKNKHSITCRRRTIKKSVQYKLRRRKTTSRNSRRRKTKKRKTKKRKTIKNTK